MKSRFESQKFLKVGRTTSKTGSYIKKTPEQCGGGPVAVFPNPARDELRIRYGGDTGVEEHRSAVFSVQLLDAMGGVAWSGDGRTNELVVNTRDLPKGIYYVVVNTGTALVRERVIIER